MPKRRSAMGPRIRELRIERNMTLHELAEAAEISTSHLSRLERGYTVPSFTVAAKLAEYLGVKASDLSRMQRQQVQIDADLIDQLIDMGIEEEMAEDICDRISTDSRTALLGALRVLTAPVSVAANGN